MPSVLELNRADCDQASSSLEKFRCSRGRYARPGCGHRQGRGENSGHHGEQGVQTGCRQCSVKGAGSPHLPCKIGPQVPVIGMSRVSASDMMGRQNGAVQRYSHSISGKRWNYRRLVAEAEEVRRVGRAGLMHEPVGHAGNGDGGR